MPKYINKGNLPIALNDVCAVRMYDSNMNITNKIYLFGGRKYENNTYSNVNTIYEYNIDTNTYTLLNYTLPDSIRLMSGVSFQNQIYLFGGIGSSNNYRTEVLRFTVSEGITYFGLNTTSMTPRFAFLFDDSDRQGTWEYPLIFLTDRSASYGVIDLSQSPITYTRITDTETLSDRFNGWINNKVYSFDHENKLNIYQIDDTGVGDLLYSFDLPTTLQFIEFVAPTGIGDEIFFIARTSSQSTTSRYVYRMNFNDGIFHELPDLEDKLRYQTGWGVSYDYNGLIDLFGGWTYYGVGSILPDLIELNFNYYSVYGNYDEDYIELSNTEDSIIRGGYYENSFIPIDGDNTYTELEFDEFTYNGENYIDRLTYNEDTHAYNIGISNVSGDIYFNILNNEYHEVNKINNEGVTINGSNKWYTGQDYIASLSLEDDYLLDSVKVFSGSQDITETVYNSETHIITISRTMFDNYTNIIIKAFANTENLTMILYKNQSDDRCVQKSLIEINRVSGTLRNETSLLTPSVLIDTTNEPNYVLDANYVYLPNFRRYYYITSISSARNHLWRLNLRVDVLMTYKDEILNQDALVYRSSNKYDPYQNDAEMVLDVNPFQEVIEIENDVLEQKLGTNNVLITTVR